MKKFLLLTVAICMVTFITPLLAQERGFGIGLIVGEPTGVSAKLWTSGVNAFDFGLGFGVGGDRIHYNGNYNDGSRTHFHMDYLWHSFDAIRSSAKIPLYYGIGGRFNSGAGYDDSFGIRGVFGIAWIPRSTPLDLFVEIVPVFQITPSTGFGFDAAIGARYFFN